MATSYPKSDYRVFRKSKFAPPAQDNNRVVLQNTKGVIVFDATKQRIFQNQKQCRVTWPTDKLCQRLRIHKADLQPQECVAALTPTLLLNLFLLLYPSCFACGGFHNRRLHPQKGDEEWSWSYVMETC